MKQWDKWKHLWMAMVTAQLVGMVLDPNFKPQAGEEKLYQQQLMAVHLQGTAQYCPRKLIEGYPTLG
jgi:hypothetical protein